MQETENTGTDGAPATPATTGGSGAINNQADVEKALGRIIDYYSRHEPSSPLPVLLNRCRRLVGADFLTIIEDLAPLGLENVKRVGGMENPE